MCTEIDFPNPPKTRESPRDGKCTSFGATLVIICQIRNNLFHGAKLEFTEPNAERNLSLVTLGHGIIKKILEGSNDIFKINIVYFFKK